MFGFSNKKSACEEFDEDIKVALESPKTTCRQDIAEMLWAKYEPMTKNIKT